jgi:tryptophan 2,3-dioxygenase
VHAAALHSLQRPRSDEPAEVAFLVVTQIMELYFGLLRHEWRCARDELAHDDLDRALAALRRSVPHVRGLNASWGSLARLSPAEFNRFRPYLGQGSGFQSAMYRQVTFLLGKKSAAMVNPHRGSPPAAEEVERALREPSLYDEALALLARRGLPIPRCVLHRDRTITHPPDPDVERAWTAIYAAPERYPQLWTLGEVLTDVAEEFGRWRRRHLLAAWHALGSKPGTGGSGGVAWLAKSVDERVFPELCTARSSGPARHPRFVPITSLL